MGIIMPPPLLRRLAVAALLLVAVQPAAAAPRRTVTLSLRNGSQSSTTVTWDPREVAMLIIDPWSYHWCKTFTSRATSQHRLFNAATAAGRKAGMTVMWSPTDAEENYIGWPQYERAHNIPRQTPVAVRNSSIPTGNDMTPFRTDCEWCVYNIAHQSAVVASQCHEVSCVMKSPEQRHEVSCVCFRLELTERSCSQRRGGLYDQWR